MKNSTRFFSGMLAVAMIGTMGASSVSAFALPGTSAVNAALKTAQVAANVNAAAVNTAVTAANVASSAAATAHNVKATAENVKQTADYIAEKNAGTMAGNAAYKVAKATEDPLQKTADAAHALTKDAVNSAATAVSLGEFLNVDAAYVELNAFRTQRGVWEWNPGNLGKKYHNLTVATSLAPLKRDPQLEATARLRAKELAILFSHTRPNGTHCSTAYPYKICGENIAKGQRSCTEVMLAWEETTEFYSGQGHRRNMLNKSLTNVGIACYKLGDQYYWCMALGQP